MGFGWDPDRYLTYADERGRPFIELLARVGADAPERVVDLGCGPGNLTRLLAERWPGADVLGVDSSAEMVERASRVAGIRAERADLRDWLAAAEPAGAELAGAEQTAAEQTAAKQTAAEQTAAGLAGAEPGGAEPGGAEAGPAAPELTAAERVDAEPAAAKGPDPEPTGAERAAAGPVDVLVSNATLQWVPGHLDLLGGLLAAVRPGGWLAFQVPGNVDEPSHTIRSELAAEPAYAPYTAGVEVPAAHDAATYLRALQGLGCQVDAWETTYLHVLTGPDPVFTWVSGTGARPTLQALPDDVRPAFEEEFRRRLREAYPDTGHGAVLPFRRVFVVARRGVGER